jgi:glycosyltransferase involved in cell wall biosynthesis
MPKIALVTDWLVHMRGGERVVHALHQMYPDAPIYTSVWRPEKLPEFAAADIRTSYLQKFYRKLGRGHEIFIPLMPAAFESFDLRDYDIVISIGNGFAKGVLTNPDTRHIAYVHTPARYLWKLGGDVRNAGRLDSGLRAWAERRLRLWDVVSSPRPDLILTNSTIDKQRIQKVWGRDSQIVHPPVPMQRFTVKKEFGGEFFLFASQLVQYKRADIAIQAALSARVPLVIVGDGPERKRLELLAGDSPLIQFKGRASDAELEQLYRDAKAFVFPGEEDFGIVMVEALASGTPVIAYNKGGACDILTDKTGILLPDQDPETFAGAMKAIDSMEIDPKVCRKRADLFDVAIFEKAVRAVVGA